MAGQKRPLYPRGSQQKYYKDPSDRLRAPKALDFVGRKIGDFIINKYLEDTIGDPGYGTGSFAATMNEGRTGDPELDAYLKGNFDLKEQGLDDRMRGDIQLIANMYGLDAEEYLSQYPIDTWEGSDQIETLLPFVPFENQEGLEGSFGEGFIDPITGNPISKEGWYEYTPEDDPYIFEGGMWHTYPGSVPSDSAATPVMHGYGEMYAPIKTEESDLTIGDPDSGMQRSVNEAYTMALADPYSKWVIHPDTGLPVLYAGDPTLEPGSPSGSQHYVMKDMFFNPFEGSGDIGGVYEDYWNIGLDKGEKILNLKGFIESFGGEPLIDKTNLKRAVAGYFSNPQTIMGSAEFDLDYYNVMYDGENDLGLAGVINKRKREYDVLMNAYHGGTLDEYLASETIAEYDDPYMGTKPHLTALNPWTEKERLFADQLADKWGPDPFWHSSEYFSKYRDEIDKFYNKGSNIVGIRPYFNSDDYSLGEYPYISGYDIYDSEYLYDNEMPELAHEMSKGSAFWSNDYLWAIRERDHMLANPDYPSGRVEERDKNKYGEYPYSMGW